MKRFIYYMNILKEDDSQEWIEKLVIDEDDEK